MKRLLLFVILLSGCSNVGWSPNVQEREQPDDTSLYSISITATYPKDQFMSSEEREEYVLLPPHAQDRLLEYYRHLLQTRIIFNIVLDELGGSKAQVSLLLHQVGAIEVGVGLW